MKKGICLLLFLVVIGWWLHEPEASWKGLPAVKEPQQDERDLPASFSKGDFTILPIARYGLTAIVLARERYRYDAGAELAPVDLALAWGPMSAAGVVNELKISQSGRWYHYRWGADGPPLEPGSIARHSANTHCLPATPEIWRKLLRVRRHQLVAMSGYLVEVRGPNFYLWRSSVSRDDVGAGACEVFWITRLESTEID